MMYIIEDDKLKQFYEENNGNFSHFSNVEDFASTFRRYSTCYNDYKLGDEIAGIEDLDGASVGWQLGFIAGIGREKNRIREWCDLGKKQIELALDSGDIAQFNYFIDGELFTYYDTIGYRKALRHLTKYLK